MLRMRSGFQTWSKQKKITAGLVAAAVLALALFHYLGGTGTVQKAKVAKGKPLVSVYTVTRQDMMRHVALSGQTISEVNVPLAPKYTGKVTAIYADLGDFVHKGQVLMEQDTGDLDIAIRQNDAATRTTSRRRTTTRSRRTSTSATSISSTSARSRRTS